MSIMLFSMLWACSGKSEEDSAVEPQPASEPAEEPADSGSEPEDTASEPEDTADDSGGE